MPSHRDKLRVSGGDADYREKHDKIFSSDNKSNKEVMPSDVWEEIHLNGRTTYRKRAVK